MIDSVTSTPLGMVIRPRPFVQRNEPSHGPLRSGPWNPPMLKKVSSAGSPTSTCRLAIRGLTSYTCNGTSSGTAACGNLSVVRSSISTSTPTWRTSDSMSCGAKNENESRPEKAKNTRRPPASQSRTAPATRGDGFRFGTSTVSTSCR